MLFRVTGAIGVFGLGECVVTALSAAGVHGPIYAALGVFMGMAMLGFLIGAQD